MATRVLVLTLLAAALFGIVYVIFVHAPLVPTTQESASSSTLVDSGKRQVYVFFSNANLDPAVSCTKVFPVARVIDDTPSFLLGTLQELLKGPTAEEKNAGYLSEIAPEANIQSLIADEGDVAVDFNPSPNPGGGSCRVTAIRAQITETLKQFGSVRHVLISSNGSTAALEP